MSQRDEQLAAGLAQLHNDMSKMTRSLEHIQSLVPVFDFGDMVESAYEAEDTEREARVAAPPVTQLPMFDYPAPMTVVFESVVINGEVVELGDDLDDRSS
jgi:hypothetical protein